MNKSKGTSNDNIHKGDHCPQGDDVDDGHITHVIYMNGERALPKSDRIEVKSCIVVEGKAEAQILLSMTATATATVVTPEPKPPKHSELLMRYICPAERLDERLGDLAELFAKHSNKHGVRSAEFWYHWQVVRSVLPYLLQLIRLELFAEWIRRIF